MMCCCLYVIVWMTGSMEKWVCHSEIIIWQYKMRQHVCVTFQLKSMKCDANWGRISRFGGHDGKYRFRHFRRGDQVGMLPVFVPGKKFSWMSVQVSHVSWLLPMAPPKIYLKPETDSLTSMSFVEFGQLKHYSGWYFNNAIMIETTIDTGVEGARQLIVGSTDRKFQVGTTPGCPLWGANACM